MVLYPLVIGGVAIIASIIGTFAVRTKTDNVERALLQGLIVSGVLIWLTNFLIFALWYWEIDRGGPGRRAGPHRARPARRGRLGAAAPA